MRPQYFQIPAVFLMFLLFEIKPLHAQLTSSSTAEVHPLAVGRTITGVISESRTRNTRSRATRVRVHLGCYTTNLRGVKDGISTGTMIYAKLKFLDPGGLQKEVAFQFPSWFAFYHGCQDNPSLLGCVKDDQQNAKFGGGTLASSMSAQVIFPPPVSSLVVPGHKVEAHKNTIQFDLQGLQKVPVTTSGSHEETSNLEAKNGTLVSCNFLQIGDKKVGANVGVVCPVSAAVTPAGACPLSARTTWHVSEDGGDVEIHVDLPMSGSPDKGALHDDKESHTGDCSEHYSPLMLFFDDNYPRFSAVSSFPLSSSSGLLFWPEPQAPGYFLVYDKNNNGQVDDGSEMFGDQDQSPNGFVELTKYDLNGDKKINKNDKIFNKLKLWQDKNSNGKVDPGEVFSLQKMGVSEIDVSYVLETGMFGNNASYGERSFFTFNKKGKKIKGTVLDVWLNEAEPKWPR